MGILPYFALILLLLISKLTAQDVFYVNWNNPVESPDGTRENPFSSLEEATQNIQSTNYEIILLGESLHIGSQISLALGVSIKIKPEREPLPEVEEQEEEEQQAQEQSMEELGEFGEFEELEEQDPRAIQTWTKYFPIYFEIGAGIAVNSGNLTFEGVQLIELNLNRNIETNLLYASAGYITLNRTKIADISYPGTTYMMFFVQGTDPKSGASIIDCEFKNLYNAMAMIFNAKFILIGSQFTNITADTTSFLNIYSNDGPNAPIYVENVSVKTANFSYIDFDAKFFTGFIDCTSCTTNVTIKDLYVKNVTLTNSVPFIWLNSMYEDPLAQTTFKLLNITLEDIFEAVDIIQGEGRQNTGIGLVFDITGCSHMIVDKFSATNVILKYDSLLRFSPIDRLFRNVWQILPSARYSHITLRDCTNPNFLTLIFYEGVLEDVNIKNSSFINPKFKFPLFLFENGNKATVKDIVGKNIRGSVLKLTQVVNQKIKNFTIDEIYSSRELDNMNQNVAQLSRTSDILAIGLEPSQQMVTVIDGFTVNGFYDVMGLNNYQDSNDTYMLVIQSEVGEVYIQNSKWHNIQMGGLFSISMKYLKVDNLLVDNDPLIPVTELPWHRVFQFVNIDKLEISNSEFKNIQNVVIFSLFNIDRSTLFSTVDRANLTLTNITVLNNTGNYWNANTTYLGLFVIDSPLKTVQVTFQDSKFKNNSCSNGLIMVLESYKVDVNLTNNTFDSNRALVGGILTAQTMQDNLNQLNLTNNVFKNNTSYGNGGVLSFINCWLSINSTNNTYDKNKASAFGGVGYVLQTKLAYVEKHSTYTSNLAGKTGGSWYISTSYQKTEPKPIRFVNTTFRKSQANQSGGALYLAIGNLALDSCFFQNNKALISGGDIYLLTFSSLYIFKSTFRQSSAPQGAFLYADSLYAEVVTINNSLIENVSQDTSATLVQLNSGQFKVFDTNFCNITASLFKLITTATIFDNVYIKNIKCLTEQSFCIIQGVSMPLTFSNSRITSVSTNSDLIVLNSPVSPTIFENVKVTNVATNDQMDFDLDNDGTEDVQLFAVKANLASDIRIQNCRFENFDHLCSVNFKSSNFLVQETVFTNEILVRRSLEDTAITPIADTRSGYAQFLVVESSRGSVIGSQFVANAPQGQVSGGAIRILGTDGDYNISQSTFQDNQARQGGAISVEGPIKSITIEDSTFTGNRAVANGGAVYFGNESVSEVSLINRSWFEANQAQTGGAIFIANESLIIDSTTFKGNLARDGGAIASFSEATSTVNITDSLFVENKAKVGSVFRVLGADNFVIGDVNYRDNKAERGGIYASNPKQLSLTIYEVEDYFLFLESPPADYMIARNKTKIVYDSRNPSMNIVLTQKTGRSPNYLFEFVYLDQKGENIPTIEEAALSISIQNFSVPRNGGLATPGILGRTVYNFNSTTLYVFNTFSVRADLNSKIILSAEGTFTNTFFKQIETLPPVQWEVTIRSCDIGEIYDEVNYICSSCATGTYSFDDPYNTQSCQRCGDTFVCLGGDIMFPKQGYWRISNISDNVVNCFNDEACVGGQRDEGLDVSMVGFCAEGYRGVACGSCTEGYAKFGTSQQCLNCTTNAGYYIRFIVFLLIQVVIIFIATKVFLQSQEAPEDKKQRAIWTAAFVKLFIDFIQIINLTSEFNFEWPSEIADFLGTISKVTPTNKDALSVGCFIALIKGNNQEIFFIKLLLIVLQPILYSAIAAIVWAIVFRIRKKKVLKNKEFSLRLIVTSLVIVYVLQPGILKTTLQLFHCQNFGSFEDKKYYLIEDTDIQCGGTQHMAWALALGIPSLIIWGLIPVGLLTYLVVRVKLKDSRRLRLKYNYVFERYKEKACYWELVIFLRKFFIIIFAVFLVSAFLQAYMSFVIIVGAYVAQSAASPFIKGRLNIAEKLSLFACGFLLYTGLFFVRPERLDSLVPWLLVFATIFGVYFLGYCVYLLMRIIFERNPKLKAKFEKFLCKLASKPGFFGKCMRRMLPKRFSPIQEDPEKSGPSKQPTDTESNPRTSFLEKPEEDQNDIQIPSTAGLVLKPADSLTELLAKEKGKSGYAQKIGSEYIEESTNPGGTVNAIGSRKENDQEPKTSLEKIDSLNSYGVDLSLNRRFSSRTTTGDKPALTHSQILELEEEKAATLPVLFPKKESEPISNNANDVNKNGRKRKVFSLNLLRDDRFKDVDRVEIQPEYEDEEMLKRIILPETPSELRLLRTSSGITGESDKGEEEKKENKKEEKGVCEERIVHEEEEEEKTEEKSVIGLSDVENEPSNVMGLDDVEIQTEQRSPRKEPEKEQESQQSVILLSLSKLMDDEDKEERDGSDNPFFF